MRIGATLFILALCLTFLGAQAQPVPRFSVYNLTETQVIAGASFVITIDGDSFKSPITTEISNALFASFHGPMTSSTTNFAARKSVLLVPGISFVSGPFANQITVRMEPDSSYDITLRDILNFTVPGIAVSLGQPSVVAASMPIHVEPGMITSSMINVDEGLVRNGGVVVALTLNLGETWVGGSMIETHSSVANFTGSMMWESKKHYLIMPAVSNVISADKRTLSITLQPATYDARSTEDITFMIPPSATASRIKPQHMGQFVFLRIFPTVGSYDTGSQVVPEMYISRGNGVFLTMSLDFGETWKKNISRMDLRASMSAVGTAPDGFNVHRTFLVPIQPELITPQLLRVHIGPHSRFDISTNEQVIFTPSGSMVDSGLPPQVKSGGSRFFIIEPSPAEGFVEYDYYIHESDVHRGTSVNITLLPGENWKAGGVLQGGRPAMDIRSALVGQLATATAFNAKKATLIPALVPLRNQLRTIEVQFLPDTTYQISQADIITMTVTGAHVGSGLAPMNNTVRIHVLPSAGLLSVSHDTMTMDPDLFRTFVFTEEHIRLGAGIFNLSWSPEETWAGINFLVGNVSVVSGPAETRGWKQFGQQRATMLQYTDMMRTLLIHMKPVRDYDITREELLRVDIPREAISSRVPSRDALERFQIRVQPSPGRPRLCCGSMVFMESDIAAGGKTVVVKLPPGEQWTAGWELQWSQALTSAMVDEPNGFNAWRSDIIPSSAFTIKNDSHEMHINLQAAPRYALVNVSETVNIFLRAPYLPTDITASRLVPLPSQLNFTILRTPPRINVSLSTKSPTEKEMIQGGVRITIGLARGEFQAGSETLIKNGFSGNASLGTGFYGLRSTLLAGSIVIGRQSVTLTLSPAADFNIEVPEVVDFRLDPAALTTGGEPDPVSFTILPSPGDVTLAVSEYQESQFIDGSPMPPVISLKLSSNERWVPAADFPLHEMMARLTYTAFGYASRFGFNESKKMLLNNSNVSFDPVMNAINITLTPTPEFDTVDVEEIHLPLSPRMVQSGIHPNGMLKFRIRPSVVVASSPGGPSTPIRTLNALGNAGDPQFSFSLMGGKFAQNRVQCYADLVRNLTVTSNDPITATYIRSQLPNMLKVGEKPGESFGVDPSGRTLTMKLFNTVPALTPAHPFGLSVALQPSCVFGAFRPIHSRLMLDLVPLNITIEPKEIREDDLRSGLANITLSLTLGGQWNNDTLNQLLTAFVGEAGLPMGFEQRRAALLGDASLPPVCDPAPANPGMMRSPPSVCISPSGSNVTIRFAADHRFDIPRNETLMFMPKATMLQNSSRVVRVDNNNIRLVVVPGHDFRVSVTTPVWNEDEISGAHYRHHMVNLTIPNGETFIDSEAAKIAIFDEISSNDTTPSLNDFDARKPIIFNVSNWMLSPDRHTWHIPVSPDPMYRIPVERPELISLNSVPAESVASMLQPMTTPKPLALIRPAPYGPAFAFIDRRHFYETTFRTMAINIILRLSGPSRTMNDTFVASQISTISFLPSANSTVSPTGFAARLTTLRPQFSLLSSHAVLIRFSLDVNFDIDQMETVNITIPSTAVQSGKAPEGNMMFSIEPAPGTITVSQDVPNITDAVIRGVAQSPVISLLLTGEKYYANDTQKPLLAASCTAPAINGVTSSWFQRRAVILNASAINFVSSTRLTMTLANDPLYELPQGVNETITCSVLPDSLFTSRIVPQSVVQFTIHGTEGGPTLAPGPGNNVVTPPLPEEPGGLSPAAIAGISIGVVLFIVLIIVIIVVCVIGGKKKDDKKEEEKKNEPAAAEKTPNNTAPAAGAAGGAAVGAGAATAASTTPRRAPPTTNEPYSQERPVYNPEDDYDDYDDEEYDDEEYDEEDYDDEYGSPENAFTPQGGTSQSPQPQPSTATRYPPVTHTPYGSNPSVSNAVATKPGTPSPSRPPPFGSSGTRTPPSQGNASAVSQL